MGPGTTRHEVVDYGDAGVLVTVTGADREGRWLTAQRLQAGLLGATGVVDVVAAYDSVLVTFDPALTDHAGVRDLVARPAADAERRLPRAFVVPVVYGGTSGPDLDAVAAELGLEPAELVRLHTSTPWTVRFRGSPGAAPFLDGPDLPAPVRRRASPRTRVPAGSVALSGQQSLVYPVDSPGGWRLIGRTPVRFVDLGDPALVPYGPGDTLRFVAVPEPDAARWDGTLAALADELVRTFG